MWWGWWREEAVSAAGIARTPLRSVTPWGAVGLALTAFTCWVAADTCIKLVGVSRLPAYEVIAGIGLAEVLLLLGYAAWRRKLGMLWPRRVGLQGLRSCLDLVNNFFVVVALRHLPLSLFYILIFLAPLVSALLAAGLLGERIVWRKGAALLTGFAGVVVAVDPFGAAPPGGWVGYAACLVCVGCFSANLVWSRVMTQTESAESLTFFSGLVMAVGGFAGMVLGVAPVSARSLGYMGVAGACCVAGSLCFFVALRHATAATVSQYHYSQLLTGALVAYVVWHQRPTGAMLAGVVLIVASGWYVAAPGGGGAVPSGFVKDSGPATEALGDLRARVTGGEG